MTTVKKDLINSLGNIFGSSFVSIKGYLSVGTVELSDYVVNVGASYANAVEKDIKTLESASYDDAIMESARLKMLNSLIGNKDAKTQSNQSKAQQDAYYKLTENSSVKLHIENGTLHIFAMEISKKVIEPAKKPKAKSSNPLVIAEYRIKKDLNLSTAKWRNFKFEQFDVIKTGGNTFTLNIGTGSIESTNA